MCLAIYSPKGNTVPHKYLKNAYERNSDGAGYAIKDIEGNIKMRKGFFSYKEFLKEYLKEDVNNEMLIHFRISTSGEINKNNCHPFYIGKKKDAVMIHNGILSGYPTSNKRSDTNYFCFHYMEDIIKGIDYEGIQFILGKAITNSNKFVIMRKGIDKETIIINKDQGSFIKGNWYSNDSYQGRCLINPMLNRFPDYNYQSYISNHLKPYKTKKVKPIEKIEKEKTNNEYIAFIKDHELCRHYDWRVIAKLFSKYPLTEFMSLDEFERFLFQNNCNEIEQKDGEYLYDPESGNLLI